MVLPWLFGRLSSLVGGGEGRGLPLPSPPFLLAVSSLPFLLKGLHLPFLVGSVSLTVFFVDPTFSCWLGGSLPSPPAFLVGQSPLSLSVGRSLFVFWAGWCPRSLPVWAVSPRRVVWGFPLRLFGASLLPSWLAPIWGSAVFPSPCLLERKEKRKEKKKKRGKKRKEKYRKNKFFKKKEEKEELLLKVADSARF